MEAQSKKRKWRKKKRMHFIRFICWITIPFLIISALILDGVGIYSFTTERLIVIGACILSLLLPFFSEITVKGVSIKRDDDDKH